MMVTATQSVRTGASGGGDVIDARRLTPEGGNRAREARIRRGGVDSCSPQALNNDMALGGPAVHLKYAHSRGSSTAGSSRSWTSAVAYVAVFFVGLNLQLYGSATTSLAVGVILFPLAVGAYARVRGLRWLAILVAACLAAALTLYAADPRSHSPGSATSVILWFLGSTLAIGVVVWASRWISLKSVIVAYAFGWITRVLVVPGDFEPNIWKYGLSQPVALAVLAIVGPWSFAVRAFAALSLSTIGFALESRSFGAICLVSFIVGELLRRRQSTRVGRASIGKSVLIGVAALGTVWLASAAIIELLTSGVFGEDLRARTVAQEGSAGGILLGGRPEWVATLALMAARPLGYGAGAIPTSHDFAIAMQGLLETGLSTSGSYYREYMFGSDFRLHSVAADLWLNFSIPGVVLAVLLLSYAMRLFIGLFTYPKDLAVAISFLSLSTLWYLLFGPFYSNFPQVTFTVAVAIVAALQYGGHSGRVSARSRGVSAPLDPR